MNIELSIYKIKNYAYSACALASLFFSMILNFRFNYSITEFIVTYISTMSFLSLPIWWESRKLNRYFKQNQ